MPTNAKIDYNKLFGKDSGENEDEQILKDYFLDLPQFKKIFNPENQLGIVHARKGMGKSALLRVLALRQKEKEPNNIVIEITGNDLRGMGDFTNKTQAYLESHWKQVICKRICVEIGKEINFAMTDNSMSMVEIAEIEGYKNLNIISALTERSMSIVQKILATTSGLKEVDGATVSNIKRGVVNPIESLKNFQEKGNKIVWFIVDDIDSKYIDDEEHQKIIGSFFSAIRSLAFNVADLRIRASVRTDVWFNLRGMEDQDKIREYIIHIEWSDSNLKAIFTKKILTYLKREGLNIPKGWTEKNNHNDLFDMVFQPPFFIGKDRVSPFILIKLLAGERPRWMGQLSKLAGENAGSEKISQKDVLDAMPAFGKDKISDIGKEHLHQFKYIDKLILSFRSGKREYTRYQLLNHIESKFIARIGSDFLINGLKYTKADQLAEFLFEIDFLYAHYSNKNEVRRFSNDPSLFDSFDNEQNKIMWTINSSYRNFLAIV